MKLTLESTDQVATVNGVDCRIWIGTTPKGIHCYAYIPVIAASSDENQEEFVAELQARHVRMADIQMPPIPLRMVI